MDKYITEGMKLRVIATGQILTAVSSETWYSKKVFTVDKKGNGVELEQYRYKGKKHWRVTNVKGSRVEVIE